MHISMTHGTTGSWKRKWLGSALGTLLVTALAGDALPASAEDLPGVTATEIKIGNTDAYSGPASSYGIIAKTETAFFKMVNDQGGVAGHKIDFLSYDDGYSPPKTVEQVRRLIEQDQVAMLFNTLGTPTNTAIERYTNLKKVPNLFISTGADKWGDYKHFPWTMGYQPSYRTEAQIYTKYMLSQNPKAKLAILYQNDDFGKDYPAGVKDVLGDKYASVVVKEASYETTDATIESQIASLQASGADTLLVAATPKFAAQAIKKVHDLGWHPTFFLTNVSISVGSVMTPAGVDNGIGIITTGYMKDPTDPAFKDDPGMNQWRTFMAKYMPDTDLTDANPVFAYGVSSVLLQVLKQCNGDFSRANIMKQAANLHNAPDPVLLPGITVNTSPTNFHPIRAMQLQKWTGKTWERFGGVIEGSGS
ncbi:ABC transporter substrate-binding protein [Acidisphaera sp. S103]|uniref:ABC transporter substrate-binding protein n=1 Tax=Acidisphaera sp. S103 TaxID=1747223 RepID=UPI001C20C3B8|nr:ABC transporter substrate-binding protein [Acidisphaera sp. S103]